MTAAPAPPGRLRIVSEDVAAIAELLREDLAGTGALGDQALAALASPELLLSPSPLSAAAAGAALLAVETLVGMRLARATADWGFATQLGAAFESAEAMLELLRPSGIGPLELAWRALLTELEIGAAVSAPARDGLLAAAGALLVAAGVPLAPRLPPATSYPGEWGDPVERRQRFATEYAEVYSTAFPSARLELDGIGRVRPTDTETALVSAAQAAMLGAPSALEADGAVIRVATYETRPPTFVAFIPGSAGLGFTSPSDWCYNVTGGAPLQAAARDALDRAIADYGAAAGDPPQIGLLGFSQGGIAALGLGARLDPEAYRLLLVETAGTPGLSPVSLPESTRVLMLADPDDPVPRLAGRPEPPGWEELVVDAGGPGPGAHSALGYARGAATLAEDPIAALSAAATGPPRMIDYFYTMR